MALRFSSVIYNYTSLRYLYVVFMSNHYRKKMYIVQNDKLF